MNVRTILFGIIALVAAGGTAFLIQNWMNSQRAALLASQPKPVQQAADTEVLVAKKNLPTGTLLKPEHLRWQAWPSSNLTPTYAVKTKRNLADFVGAVVRQGIVAGEPVTDARVVKPGESGFLAAVLKEGYRAATVPINATSGIAGFVFPGDRVDLILTHGVTDVEGDDSKRKRYVSQTMLEEIRVLALDQKHDDQTGKPSLSKTATFEVTPKQAELIQVALELGRLSLSLRGLKRNEREMALMEEQMEEQQMKDAAIAAAASNGGPAAPQIASTEPFPSPAGPATGANKPMALMRSSAATDASDEPEHPAESMLGKSVSWDSDASAVLRHPAADEEVFTLLRGSNSQTLKVRRPQ